MAGIYLHIPFCKQACTYCNFHFSTSLRQKDALLQALLKEIKLQKDWLQGQTIETIYLGGGTPSLLTADEISRLFDALFVTFNIDSLKECTLEANPDDLSIPYLRSLSKTAVDRLSVGIQSFHEENLRYMNRAHTAQQSDYALKAAQDTGFSNLSIDLIYGTPGLSDKAWRENVSRMAGLQIPHFSAYALTVEEGTALDHAIAKKGAAPVDAAQSAAQAELLMEEAVRLGYEQYEISNYAKPGCYAVHNTSYWQGTPYLGLGPSAHSFNGRNIRRWNVSNNALYIQSLLGEAKIPFEQEELTALQRLNEYIMTSLRTMWGCDLRRVESEWGSDYKMELLANATRFIEASKMELKADKLLLSSKGKLFADGIASDLFFTEAS
jgi:oxygen-independent coproporphyrinogen III oxidase